MIDIAELYARRSPAKSPDISSIEWDCWFTDKQTIAHLLLLGDHLADYGFRSMDDQCVSCSIWHAEILKSMAVLEAPKFFTGKHLETYDEINKFAQKVQDKFVANKLTQKEAIEYAKEARELRYKLVGFGIYDFSVAEVASLAESLLQDRHLEEMAKVFESKVELEHPIYIPMTVETEDRSKKAGFMALVDTGSAVSAITKQDADRLGLKAVTTLPLTMANGEVVQGEMANCRIIAAGQDWTSSIWIGAAQVLIGWIDLQARGLTPAVLQEETKVSDKRQLVDLSHLYLLQQEGEMKQTIDLSDIWKGKEEEQLPEPPVQPKPWPNALYNRKEITLSSLYPVAEQEQNKTSVDMQLAVIIGLANDARKYLKQGIPISYLLNDIKIAVGIAQRRYAELSDSEEHFSEDALLEARREKPSYIEVKKTTIEEHYKPPSAFHEGSIRTEPELAKKGILVRLGCPLSEKWDAATETCSKQGVVHIILPKIPRYMKSVNRWKGKGVRIEYKEEEVGVEPRAMAFANGELQEILEAAGLKEEGE